MTSKSGIDTRNVTESKAMILIGKKESILVTGRQSAGGL